MIRSWTVTAMFWFAVTGCYNPSYQDCEVSCAMGTECPSGFSCVAQKCRPPGAPPSCPATSDASVDANTCDLSQWTYDPANVRGCAYQLGTFDWSFASIIDVNTGGNGSITHATGSSGAVPPFTMLPGPMGGPGLMVIVLRSLGMQPVSEIRVTGGRALVIIVNGDATINKLDAAAKGALPGPGAEPLLCTLTGGGGDGGTSIDGTSGGGGGGGGSFGTVGSGMRLGKNGGIGGVSGMPLGGVGGFEELSTLIPLRGGCQGGKGGNASGNTGALGGGGGGAIQISARGSITINNELNGGGGGGLATARSEPGGGGGGAGGGIVLEAITVTVPFGSAVCANGGGGGSGGGTMSSAGENGGCVSRARGGGAGTPVVGGFGATTSAEATVGGSSTTATTPPTGGAGGGGGVGRIRIKGTLMNNGIITPAPVIVP